MTRGVEDSRTARAGAADDRPHDADLAARLGARTGTLRLSHATLHYAERGSGPLVVLLHGFPEFWWGWRHQMPALAEAGFRVVAPDQRGYNLSSKPGPYDLDTLADDIAELIRALGAERAHVVGHDWGGAVAWHLAVRHSEVVERLVVLNCPHPALMLARATRHLRQAVRSWYIAFFQLPWLPERLLAARRARAIARAMRGMLVHRDAVTRAELEPYRAAALRPGALPAMLGWYRTFARRGRRQLETYRDSLVIAPTLLVWGMQDRALDYAVVVPGTEEYVHRLSIQTIPDAGHFVQHERPSVVNRLLVEHLRAMPT